MSANILDDYVDLEPFSKQISRHSRTVRRWLNQPDGLPYTRIGNRIFDSYPDSPRVASRTDAPRSATAP